VQLDDPQEGRAALQQLLRLAASNIGGADQGEELSRVVGELAQDPVRVAWFAYVAGCVAAAAAWRFARDAEDEPAESDAVEALASLELAVEEQLGT
jgi:hypothetical protein